MEYSLIRSKRSKHVRLRVVPGGAIVVTAPPRYSEAAIAAFVSKQASWIARAVARMVHLKTLPVSGRRDYLANKEKSRAFVSERIAFWNQHYGYRFGRVAIKDTRRTWGSCSAHDNLNFSYRIAFLPPELADYVIVHELCHLKEHNHSPAFWALVAKTQPQYRALRRELRRYILHA